VPAENQPIDEAGIPRDWFAGPMLLRAAGGVFSMRVLLLAAIGMLLAEAGSWVLVGTIPAASGELELAGSELLSSELASSHLANSKRGKIEFDYQRLDPAQLLQQAADGQAKFVRSFASPFWTPSRSVSDMALQLSAGCWRIAVWSLFGVAIARIAAMHLTHHKRPSLGVALGRSLRNWLGQAAGPLVILLIVGVLVGVIWLLGVTAQVKFLGVGIALVWPLVFLLGLVAGLLSLGLTLGWPLMVASQAVERPDPFDAVSCGFAYVYQRPVRLIAYALQAWIVAIVVGALVLLALQLGTIFLAPWYVAHPAPTGATRSLIAFWMNAVTHAPQVFHAAYFWFAAVTLYLLLRRDIDEKQADELFLDDQPPALPDAALSEAESASVEGDSPSGAVDSAAT